MTDTIHLVITRLARRLRTAEEGFTLIEMINVMLILGILMSISVSAYSTLHERAEQKSALANVRAILPAVEQWRVDHGTYAGMTMALLNATYLSGSLDVTYFDVGPTLSTSYYCVQYTAPSGTYVAKADSNSGVAVVGGPSNVCV